MQQAGPDQSLKRLHYIQRRADRHWSGDPIDEPILGSGQFVMNTAQEIRQAIADYSSGRMGRLS